MKLGDAHLSYCLNIHRGESWAENKEAIHTSARAVRDQLGVTQPFGLGLRIGAAAAQDLRDPAERQAFAAYLAEHNLYAFTVNAFPFGTFHGTRVKEQVYAPDWRSDERVEYTTLIADILADILPEGVEGSISTVPASFKPWIKTDADVDAMIERVLRTATHLRHLEREQGTYIHLGLEPEPACYLETTPEMVAFYKKLLVAAIAADPANGEELVRRYVGVCFDCCHFALQFEDLEQSLDTYLDEGILISKVHLSAALHLDVADHIDGELDTEALRAFDEPVYLHQVKARTADGIVHGWTDLPAGLDGVAELKQAQANHADAAALEAIRCHFHVPLFWAGNPGGLGTTRDCLTPAFFKKLRHATPHLEIETYTFDVMPAELQKPDVVASIVPEFQWVLAQFSV